MVMEAPSDIYHTFEFDDGTVIPGVWDHRPVMKHFNFPVAGKTLIDVGCRDGLFCRHFEKLGATVTGVDIIDRPMRRRLTSEFGCKFKFWHQNVMQLGVSPANAYDIAFCGDMIQHVESPLAALRMLHHVCKERLYLVVDVHPELKDTCKVSTDVILPWYFGPDYIVDLISHAGWRGADKVAKYKLAGNLYRPRDVMIFTAEADPDFSFENLQNSPLWPIASSQNLDATLRVEK